MIRLCELKIWHRFPDKEGLPTHFMAQKKHHLHVDHFKSSVFLTHVSNHLERVRLNNYTRRHITLVKTVTFFLFVASHTLRFQCIFVSLLSDGSDLVYANIIFF